MWSWESLETVRREEAVLAGAGIDTTSPRLKTASVGSSPAQNPMVYTPTSTCK